RITVLGGTSRDVARRPLGRIRGDRVRTAGGLRGAARRRAEASGFGGGGSSPIWRRDGTELFYGARNGTLMSVMVRGRGDRAEFGEPQPLFPLEEFTSGTAIFRRPYDVSPDGERFLIIRRGSDSQPDDAAIVMNWTTAFERPK